MDKKWYRNSLIIAASLILFFPIGLIWMWALATWSKKAKIVVSSIFAILLVIGMASGGSKPSTGTTGATTPQPTAVVEKTKPTEAPALSESEQIKAIVTEQLKGTNNMKRDNLKKVDVSEAVGGGWNVAVEFNAGDNLSTKLRKTGIEKKMSEIYISLYTSGKDIKTVSVAAFFPLADQYGNESDGIVYKSTLAKEEANKVNWSADGSTLRLSILPKVWTTIMLHPEFR